MKIITKPMACLIICCLSIGAIAQTMPSAHSWKITLKVLDEAEHPIKEAKTRVFYLMTNEIAGLTDSDGLFTAAHQDGSENLAFQIEKPGYYSSFIRYHMGRIYKTEKWNSMQTVYLRKIGKPIPMFAKHEEAKLQQEDVPMGFDLTAGDWVVPNGHGTHADMFFYIQRKIINEREYDCTLTVTFPNKGDGIAVAPTETITGSDFKTSRTASDQEYESQLVLHYSNKGQPEGVFGYFIRVQTVLDEDGKVKSALYGKIPGNFRFYAGTKAPRAGMGFTYYLNPTPNNRNVEFDPKHNLLKGLKPLEAVTEP